MDGKEYPIEVHLVHVNTKYYVDGLPSADNFAKSDGLAVIGIFYEVSTEDNANLTDIVSKVMKNANLTLESGWSGLNLCQGERGGSGDEEKAQTRQVEFGRPSYDPCP